MTYEMMMESPLGPLRLRASEQGLTGLYFAEHKKAPELEAQTREHEILRLAKKQLEEYFAGRRRVFDLPLDPRGTEFQKRVWMALRGIEFGGSLSYGELAREVGSPKAARAVGYANSLNPLSIVVPCHRVVGSTGKLTGYAGGLPSKEWLLAHERSLVLASSPESSR